MGSVRVAALRNFCSAWCFVAALLCISLLALCTSCGGGSKALPDKEEASPLSGLDSLPPPAALRHVSYTPAELVCCGWEYITAHGFPQQNVCGVDECAEFTPDWTPADPSADGLAYSCYGFDMADYDRAEKITFTWDQEGDPGDLWIGLADFARNCWSWHTLDGGTTLELPLADYIDPVEKRMLILPVMTGTSTWHLNRIHVGDLASVSGSVFMDEFGMGLYDAEVVLAGPEDYTARADYGGQWSVEGVLPGTYEVTPYLIGWSFTPASSSLTVDDLQEQVEDFIGTPLPAHTASGMVVDTKLNPLGGVELVVAPQDSPYGSVSTWSDYDGNWFIDLPDGDYTVTPDMAGWFFTPESRQFTIAGGSVFVDTFTGEPLPGYLVDGYVYEPDGVTPVSDVQLSLMDDEQGLYYYAFTDPSGYWYAPEVVDGNYIVEPMLYGWMFQPEVQYITVAGDNLRVPPFTAGALSQYTVDGYVYLDDGSTPVPSVQVQLMGDYGWYYATTNSAGRYIFSGVYEGYYDVSPADIHYEFEPQMRSINVKGDMTVDPFLATTLPTFKVDGYIYQPDGTTGVEGVLVTVYAYIPAGSSFEATTGADGYWQAPAVPNGWYTVWPFRQGYSFEPPDQAITVEDADVTVDDFIGTALPSYTMSGYVYELDGSTPVPGVTVSLYGWSYEFETATDINGYWELDEVFEDSYTVVPMLAPWVFTPLFREVEVSGGNVVVDPFLGEMLPAWTVDGYVYETESTTPVPDVDIWFYCDEMTYRCTTDVDGHYEVPLPAGFWVASPDSSCFSFDPSYQEFTVSGAALTLPVFYATPGG